MNRIELGAIGCNGSLGVSWADLKLPDCWMRLIERIAPESRPTDIQRKVLGEMQVLEKRRNLIVSAPTNSGKSLLGFLLLLDTVRLGKRALLLEPYRAIAQEKFDELSRLLPTLSQFVGKKVSVKISTGDYRLEDEMMQAPPPNSGEILVATPERIEAIMRRPDYTEWWSSFGAVCVDEAHLISNGRRGPTLEFLITSLLVANTPPRIVLLSATLGETAEAQKWLEPCDIAHSAMRHPLLERTVVALNDEETADEAVLQIATELVPAADTNLLIFTYRTDSAAKLTRLLNERLPGRFGVDGAVAYHAQMPKTTRDKMRASYCSGRSRCVVTTTALAAGVNLPTTHVIVRDLTFQGTDPLPVDQLVQMAGRAGRGEKHGHAFFIHRTNDVWKIDRLLSELKEPTFPELSSALRGVGGRSEPQDRERCIPRAAAVMLSLLTRRDAAMSETEIEKFFNRSLVGNAFRVTLHEALHWICDSRRILAYRKEEGSIAATSLGKAAIRGTLPLIFAAGFGGLVRDVLSLGEEKAFFGDWTELDHLLITELLSERSVNLRPFSNELARQVDSWMERSPKKSILYRSLLRGSAGFSKAEELFGSLLLENAKNHLNDSERARRKGYLAMSRAIVLWQRASGADPSHIERNWRFSDLAGIEESWRDDRIWLLSALTEVCDLRCFYFYLHEECGAGEERIREVKRLLQRLRVLAFDALGSLKYCSPLGPLLTQMRRGAGSRGVGINTIRKLERLGVESLVRIAKMSGNDFKNAGINPAIAKRIESYVRRRLLYG